MVAQLGRARLVPHQLGFTYKGLSGLPENFIYNTGNEHPLRRLVSIFLSPLATSYLLVAALLLAVAWWLRLRPRLVIWVADRRAALRRAALDALARSYLALALGLAVYAIVRPQARLRNGEHGPHQAALLHEPYADQPDAHRAGGAAAEVHGGRREMNAGRSGLDACALSCRRTGRA